MRKTSYLWCVQLVVGLAACSGCISSHVAWVEGWEPDVPEALEANCRFAGDNGPAAFAATHLNYIGNPNDEAMEVSIFLEKGEPEPGNGLLAKVNNVFSFCTIGLWPWVRSQDQSCTVEVVAYGEKAKREFVLGHRTWSSFILPIGLLPCPGWGDWRSAATFKLDFERGPGQEMWEADIVAGYVGELLTEDLLAKFKNKRGMMHKPVTVTREKAGQ